MDTGLWMEQAHLLLLEQRNQDAFEKIRAILHDEPHNDRAIALLARYYFNINDYPSGIQCIQDAISITSKEDYYHYLLAFGLYQNNEPLEARKSIQKAISLSPYIGSYFGLHALISLELQENTVACTLADEGLSIEPNSLEILNAKLIALQRLNRHEEVGIVLEKIVEIDPKNVVAHHAIGWNYLEKGAWLEAKDHFKSATALDTTLLAAQIGYKESLKTSWGPYRWLLQYSRWLKTRHTSMRWIIPFGLLLLFNLSSKFAKAFNFNLLFLIVVFVYALIILGTWLIPHIAVLRIKRDPVGTNFLTNVELYRAYTVLAGFMIGISICMISFIPRLQDFQSQWILSGISVMIAALISGTLQYPVQLNIKSLSGSITFLLMVMAILSSLICFFSETTASALLIGAMLGLLFRNWASVFNK